jgi:hypothetical protein
MTSMNTRGHPAAPLEKKRLRKQAKMRVSRPGRQKTDFTKRKT